MISLDFFNLSQNLPTSLEYYCELNPYFIVQAIQLYLEGESVESIGQAASYAQSLDKIKEMLKILVNCCPNLQEPLFLISKLYFIANNSKLALPLLESCIQINQAYSEAHLLKAKILISKGSYQAAGQTLETALGHNFEVHTNKKT